MPPSRSSLVSEAFVMNILWTVALECSSPSAHMISLHILLQQLIHIGLHSYKVYFHFWKQVLIKFLFLKIKKYPSV